MKPKIFIIDEQNTWTQTIIKGYKIFYSGHVYNYELIEIPRISKNLGKSVFDIYIDISYINSL